MNSGPAAGGDVGEGWGRSEERRPHAARGSKSGAELTKPARGLSICSRRSRSVQAGRCRVSPGRQPWGVARTTARLLYPAHQMPSPEFGRGVTPSAGMKVSPRLLASAALAESSAGPHHPAVTTPAPVSTTDQAPTGIATSSPGTTTADSDGVRRQRARLIVLLGALSAFGPLSLDMYLPGLPALRREFEAGASGVQFTISACLLGLALGQVLSGPLSDALGRRRPLLVGLAGYALISLLCAVAPSVPVLIGLRFVQGLAGAAGIVIARAVVRDLHSGVAAARFFSQLMLVTGAAPILAPIIGGQLLRVMAWRGIFVVLGAIGAVLFVSAAVGLRETLPPERRHGGGLRATVGVFGRLFGDRQFIGYALSCGLALGAMFAYIAGSPFVMQDIHGVSPQLFSVIFGLNALGFVVSGQINGRLVGRVPLTRLLARGLIAHLTGSLVLLAVILSDRIGLAGIIPALFVVVASLGFIMPNAIALAMAAHARTAGSASALLGLIQYGFGAAAAPLVGIAGETTARPMALVMATLGVAALLVYLRLARPATTAPLD